MAAPRWRLLVGAALVVIALATSGATYSAFSSKSTGTGNRFAAGTVRLGDNDSDVTMLQFANAQPGTTDTGCITVTYTGTLPSVVRLTAATSGDLAAYLDVTVTRGVDNTPAFDACTGFVPDATDYQGLGPGVVYQGTLAAMPAAWATAAADPPSGTVESWTTNEARSYRVSVTLANNSAAQGKTATASFTWQARNQ